MWIAGIPMFPKDECEVVHENVFIHKPKYDGSEYTVWLKVGVQYFSVGMSYDDKQHADFHAAMLVKAVEKLKSGER